MVYSATLLRALQRDLDAQLYEVKEYREDLKRYNIKPNERIVYYSLGTRTDEIVVESHWEQVFEFVDRHADDKFLASSRAIQEVSFFVF